MPFPGIQPPMALSGCGKSDIKGFSVCNEISIRKSRLLLRVISGAFTEVGASELGFAGYQ